MIRYVLLESGTIVSELLVFLSGLVVQRSGNYTCEIRHPIYQDNNLIVHQTVV